MPIKIQETPDSRSYRDGKDSVDASLEYVIQGTIDRTIVLNTVRATAPATFPDEAKLVRGDITVRPLGGLLWRATVAYIPDYAPLYPARGLAGPPIEPPLAPNLTDPLGADFAFDITAQTEHVTQSIETVSRTNRGGGVAPDYKGAIGVTKDSILGCDRIKPYLEWSRTVTLTATTFDYWYQVSTLVGTTNQGTFYGTSAGKQLFLGVSGNIKDFNKCVATFKFAYAPDLASILICDGLTVPIKAAWDFLWVAYKNIDDTNKLAQQPFAAFVERIYRRSDFSTLGIG